MNPCRVLAAELASAAALVAFASAAPVASAPVGSAPVGSVPRASAPVVSGTEADPGTTVVVAGDGYHVAAGDVVVRLAAGERAAVVEIARHGDGPDVRIPVGAERPRRTGMHMLAGP
ncbi:hypothetical protein [Embleya sp. NPDC020886]|uniref:hypothetical protein n=1 Tax=Embleya sp. NPDC020886 TaxID=3363980 RepID=UPI0037967749